jgi:hypothetical protein
MTWTTLQAEAFDKSVQTGQVVVRILVGGETIHLTTEERAAQGGTEYGPGAPLIRSISEISYEAPITLGSGADQIAAVSIEALNARLPITDQDPDIPTRYNYGRLSDYLSQYALAGPNMTPHGSPTVYDFRPGQVQIYLAAYQTGISDHFLFRGLMYDFEVAENGTVVVMRCIEDVRWDRQIEHTINPRNFLALRAEASGLQFPVSYGQHGVWHHKDFPRSQVSTNGPFHRYNPLFAKCLNLSPTAPANSYRSKKSSYNLHEQFIVTRHQYPPEGLDSSLSGLHTKALVVPYGPNMVAMPFNEPDFINYHGTVFSGADFLDSASYVSEDGLYEQLKFGQATTQSAYYGVAHLLPTKHGGTFTAASGLPADNMVSLFGSHSTYGTAHLDRSLGHLIDGDRYTWFNDLNLSVPGNATRVAIFEMGGQYPYLGAVHDIRAIVVGRRRSGSGSLYCAVYLEPDDTNLCSASITLTPMSNGYCFGSASINQPAAPQLYETGLERWEFRNSTLNKPMLCALSWTKNAHEDNWDIIGFAIVIEFDPFFEFLNYKEVEIGRRETEVYDGAGRAKRKVVVDVGLARIMGERLPDPMQNVWYAGWANGRASDSHSEKVWPNVAVSTWKTLQNPAWILRDMILTYGGAYNTTNQVNWPPISESQIEEGADSPHSFMLAADALNDAVIEAAAQGQAETFKIDFCAANWNGTRELVRALCAGTPGLRLVSLPEKGTSDSSSTRPSIGCVWPITGADVTYDRKAIDLAADCLNVSWEVTPRDEVINELRLQYGYSSPQGGYTRELWCTMELFESGMPWNSKYAGGVETIVSSLGDSGDYKATDMSVLMDESYNRYGAQRRQIQLPYVFRWHEALAIRNWILRWYGFQRVRLKLLASSRIADLQVGDVFKLSSEADKFMDCEPPIQQVPYAGGYGWGSMKFMVESITYMPQSTGLLLARINAINCDRYGPGMTGW